MKISPPNVWTEPARGSYLGKEALERPGLELMRSFQAPDGVRPPICRLLGLEVVEVGAGLTTFSLPASDWLMAATGGYSGGVIALAADGALGGALITVLDSGQMLTTSELSLSYLRPATPAAGHLIARGRLVHAARTLGLSEVFVSDARGRLVAHGSSRCVFLPIPPGFQVPQPVRAVATTPDPYLRPVAGTAITDRFADMPYSGVFDAWLESELPAPPIGHLIGIRPTGHGAGTAEIRMPASEWLNNAFGVIYGGAIALLADTAIAGATWRTMSRGEVLASLNLHVYFLRPALADGRDLVARGTVTHAGKRLRVATAEVHDAEGRHLASATGSAKVISDRRPTLVD